jgi:hypothetical protein
MMLQILEDVNPILSALQTHSFEKELLRSLTIRKNGTGELVVLNMFLVPILDSYPRNYCLLAPIGTYA